jgi:hypothetical protein
LLDHHVDRFFLRSRQRPLLENRASRADEIEEAIRVDVFLEKRPIGRVLVDVTLLDIDLVLLQKTSGVPACGSGRLPIEDRLRHESNLRSKLICVE